MWLGKMAQDFAEFVGFLWKCKHFNWDRLHGSIYNIKFNKL